MLYLLFVFLGNGNDDLTKIFDDTNVIQLLNNELFLCYKMDPLSPSFKNFKAICILLLFYFNSFLFI